MTMIFVSMNITTREQALAKQTKMADIAEVSKNAVEKINKEAAAVAAIASEIAVQVRAAKLAAEAAARAAERAQNVAEEISKTTAPKKN